MPTKPIPPYQKIEDEELFREMARIAAEERGAYGDELPPFSSYPSTPKGTIEPQARGAASPEVAPAQAQSDEDAMSEMPPEVFAELVRRFQALPRRSPQRKSGRVSGDFNGKTYTYDKYDEAEDMGFRPDRGRGQTINILKFIAQDMFGLREENIARRSEVERQRLADKELQQRQINSDRTYELGKEGLEVSRGAAADARRDRGIDRRIDAGNQASMRAARMYDTLVDAADPQKAAAARLANAQAANIEKGLTKEGGAPKGSDAKPPMTQAQAYDQLRNVEGELRAIEADIARMQKTQPLGNKYQTGEAPTIYEDTNFTDEKGNIIRTVPGAEHDNEWRRLQVDRNFYTNQRNKLRRYLRTGEWDDAINPANPNKTVAPGTGTVDDYEDDDPTEVLPPDPDVDDSRYATPVHAEGQRAVMDAQREVLGDGGWITDKSGVLGIGIQSDQRTPIPPADVVSRMNEWGRTFYSVMQRHPMMTNAEGARMTAEILRSKGMVGMPVKPTKPEPSPSSPRYRR